MITFRRNKLLLPLGLPMTLLAIIGVAIGAIDDPNWLNSLRQNIPSELIGVAVGVLVTVFYVDKLITVEEARRWLPLRRKILISIGSNSESALFCVNPYVHFAPPETRCDAIVSAFLSRPNIPLSSIIRAKDVEHIRDILGEHLNRISDIADRGANIINDNPTLQTLLIEIDQSFKMLNAAIGLHSNSLAERSIDKQTATLEQYYPLVEYPLLQVLTALARAYHVSHDGGVSS